MPILVRRSTPLRQDCIEDVAMVEHANNGAHPKQTCALEQHIDNCRNCFDRYRQVKTAVAPGKLLGVSTELILRNLFPVKK